MKFVAAFLVLVCLAYVANAQNCGGSCTSSARCASEHHDIDCRCSYLTCKKVEHCGGGCLTDNQCANWAGGDQKCVCTWWFECEIESKAKNPGYLPFLKIAAMAKANQSFKDLQEANREKAQE